MTLEEKEQLLLKSTYNIHDIIKLSNCSRNKAKEIMMICKYKFNGEVKFRPNVITSSSYWKYEGSSVEDQYKLLGFAKGYHEEEL